MVQKHSRMNVGIRKDQYLAIRKLVGFSKGQWKSINLFVQQAVDAKLSRVKTK